MTCCAERRPAAQITLPTRSLSLWILTALLLGLGVGLAALPSAATAAASTPDLGEAETGGSHHLVWWPGAPELSIGGWVPLHRLDGGTIGVISSETDGGKWLATLAEAYPGLADLGPYDAGAPYYLISPTAYARLVRGEIPPAWQVVLPSSGPDTPSPIDLARIPALARDRAAVLVRLPESMRAIAQSPGGHCRPLRTPDEALAREAKAAERNAAMRATGTDPASPPGPDPLRTQEPAYWQSMVKAVNTDHFDADLDYLSTTLLTRYYSTAQMNQACQYVYDEFDSLGLITSFDPFTYAGHSLKNVLGVKLGTVDPSRIYIIQGHLDSTSPQPQTLAPGADDNGSGAVAVLEAARLFSNIPTDYTIYFLCVSAEEQGLRGSEHFAALCDQQNLNVQGVLTFDMIGWYDPAGSDLWIEGFHQGVSSVWLMTALRQNAGTYAGLSTYLYPGEGWGSDHEPFHDHGFSAILSIENEWEDYPCYHRTCDTVENLTGWFWQKITAANVVTLGQLAQAQGALGAIHGSVTVVGGGDPADATLRLQGTTYASVVSDAGGSFTLPALFPGTYTLIGERSGFEPVSQIVEVPDGGTVEVSVEFGTLLPASVQGFVRGRSGLPFYGARVEIEGQSTWALTDVNGSFTITPVAPGPVNLSASYPGMFPRGLTVQVAPGQAVTDLGFVLASSWNFESSAEGLVPSAGWEWGADPVAGAHSGAQVWGTVLGGDYGACADYRLDFPAISLRNYPYARLHLWSWYEAEAGADGGNLEASTDGGATWEVVTPEPGYDGLLAGACNPLNGAPALTGSPGGWIEHAWPLDAYLGDWVRLRLHFGSDEAGAARGWYVDDLSLQTSPGSAEVPVESGPTPSRLELSIGPNPASDAATITLLSPVEVDGRLAIFAADGRQVATLAASRRYPAGTHRFAWMGRDDTGHRVPAGTYWVRFVGSVAKGDNADGAAANDLGVNGSGKISAARPIVWLR